MILIYTTFPSEEECKKIVQTLLEKKLIACANYSEVKGMYLWEGEIERSCEIGCFLKTKKENIPEIEKIMKTLHSYEVPCFIIISAQASQQYGLWIEQSLL